MTVSLLGHDMIGYGSQRLKRWDFRWLQRQTHTNTWFITNITKYTCVVVLDYCLYHVVSVHDFHLCHVHGVAHVYHYGVVHGCCPYDASQLDLDCAYWHCVVGCHACVHSFLCLSGHVLHPLFATKCPTCKITAARWKTWCVYKHQLSQMTPETIHAQRMTWMTACQRFDIAINGDWAAAVTIIIQQQ